MPRFALLLLCLLMALPALAQTPPPAAGTTPPPDDPYTITGVEVDVKGSNGVDARDKAFTSGGRDALKTLSMKLSGRDKAPDFKTVDDNAISRLIKSFEVEEEKTSGTRYIGKLTFHFNPDHTRAFLENRGIRLKDELASDEEGGGPSPDITSAGPRVVVLPIVRLGPRGVLWEEKTAWLGAWENYVSTNGMADIVVPEGTLGDVNAISASEALAGLPAPLSKMVARYEAHGVLVAALANSDATAPGQPIPVQLAYFDSHGVMQHTRSFMLPADVTQKSQQPLREAVVYAINTLRQTMTAEAKASAPPTPVVVGGPLQLTFTV
ncbi:MAG TPA: DUF2066 domain-containing protein, partial [Alphaproteobacteria bacterium]|nr:DUF2066 domain-containing protein [Alphaproteobacteria bacterium]